MFSLVVPVCNEARIIQNALVHMVTELRSLGQPFEIVVCENGSADGTLDILEKLQGTYEEIRVESLLVPNYGSALRHGILASRYQIAGIANIDFWSLEFLKSAIPRLCDFDMVIGSKNIKGASDKRPLLRRLITRSFMSFLQLSFGFRGTETHGLKAFRRDAIVDIVKLCKADQWLFDTELVLRAERRGLRLREVPVSVKELRQPGYWSLVRRFPITVLGLLRMYRDLRTAP